MTCMVDLGDGLEPIPCHDKRQAELLLSLYSALTRLPGAITQPFAPIDDRHAHPKVEPR
jgi:hypothetical protein